MHYYAKDVARVAKILEGLELIEPTDPDAPDDDDMTVFIGKVPVVNVHTEALGHLVNYDGLGWAWEPPADGIAQEVQQATGFDLAGYSVRSSEVHKADQRRPSVTLHLERYGA